MNIADLVLSIGVKGSEKSASTIEGVKKNLSDTKSMALETKAAIVGAAYALERFFAASGQRGTDLKNFSTYTGIAVETLQEYQYAANQVGASNEEMQGTFESLQSAMAKTLMNQGAPGMLATLSDRLKIDINERDIERFKKHPEEFLQLLQRYAQVEKDAGRRNEVFKSFGIGKNVAVALDQQMFNPKTLGQAPKYSENQVDALNKANIAWENLYRKIQMSIGKFNAEHGNEIVSGISQIVTKLLELAEAFDKFAEKMHLFDWFAKSIEGWTKILQGFALAIEAIAKLKTGDIETLTKGVGIEFKEWAFGTEEEQENYKKELKRKADNKKKIQENYQKGIPPPPGYTPQGDLIEESMYYQGGKSPNAPAATPASTTQPGATAKIIPISTAKVAAPTNLPPVQNNVKTSSTNVNVQQTLNFNHDGKDSTRVASELKKATSEAFRQQPQGQVK